MQAVLAGAVAPACGLVAFAAGAGALLAWQHGLYTNLLLALLAALWACVALFLRGMRLPVIRTPPVPSERLARAENLLVGLRVLLDQVPAPLLLRTDDGVLRAQNRAARAVFGTDDRVLDAAEPLRAAIARLPPGERAVVPVGPRAGVGPARSYALTVAQVHGTGGIGRLAVLTDIDAELQAAEATALRGLLGVLSHEIMNSLTPVTSLADTARALLTDATPDSTLAAVDALETIGRRAAGLNRFVVGYRLLARLPAPVMRPVSLAALLREAQALFDDRGGAVTLSVELPEPDALVRLDPDLTMQALLNLLGNAADAARDGAGWVSLRSTLDAERAVFCIRDGGPGVAPDQEEAIFRPFFTLKPEGTGIGLVLARQIAQSQGGSLVLETPAAGQGAGFRLTL